MSKLNDYMLIKHLSSIHQVPTSHSCGLKQVLLSNEETNSKITQIAITQLKQGETAEEHCHPDMEEYFFILDGVMRIKVDNKSYDCVRGDFIIVSHGERHELHASLDCKVLTIGCEF